MATGSTTDLAGKVNQWLLGKYCTQTKITEVDTIGVQGCGDDRLGYRVRGM